MPDAPPAASQPASQQEDKKKRLKDTLNLPKTDFAMKANLPQREPERLATWESAGLYEQIRRARAGAPKYILHDGPPYANGAIHLGHALNKCIKDFVVKTKTMAGFDSPYVPGWDCHGLPIEIKVDEQLGGRKLELNPIAGPPGLPRVRAEVHRPAALAIQAARRLRPLGQSLLHDELPLRGAHRRDLLRLLREGLRLQGPQARLLVLARPHRTRRGRGRVRDAHLALRLRALQAHLAARADRPAASPAARSTRSSGRRRRGRCQRRWPSRSIRRSNTSRSTTASTCTSSRASLLRATREACDEAGDLKNATEIASFKGDKLERVTFAHPFSRPRDPRRPRRLRHHRTRHRRRPHGALARPRRLRHRLRSTICR